jgi:catechol 2,3-dioxygenase-like lactoylglutathione lyase family enzyme
MPVAATVPVLQVTDVAASMRWYKDVLGFDGSAFPNEEPYTFALLRRDGSELMLQSSHEAPISLGWAVYIRVTGNQLLDLAAHVRARVPLSREPERMPYCDVEFTVADPDGHELVLSEQLPDNAAVQSVRED